MKRIFNVLIFLLIGGSASCLADGIYLGASLGSQTDDFTKNGSVSMLNSQTYQPIHEKTVSGTDTAGGVLGEIQLGYRQRVTQHFTFGMEGDFSVGSADVKLVYPDPNTQEVNNADESIRYTLGVSLMPSFQFNKKALVFMRAGIGFSQLQLNSDGYMYNIANSRPLNQDDHYVVLGTGLNVQYTKHWALRIEADYLRFGSFSVDEERINDTQPGGQQKIYDYKATYKPYAVRALVGLTYLY